MVLVHIFSYLEIEDLSRASGVCYDWWKLITRGAYLREAELHELDLSGLEDLYRLLPLKMFATLMRLNISSTRISNQHFLQIICAAKNLETWTPQTVHPLRRAPFLKLRMLSAVD